MSVHTHGVRVIRDDLCPAGGGGQPGAGAVQRGGGVGVAARPGQVQRGHAAWPGVISRASNEFSRRLREDFTVTEKAPTSAFSRLKVPTSAFTLKHYGKQASTVSTCEIEMSKQRLKGMSQRWNC